MYTFPRGVEGHCYSSDCALHSAKGAGAGAPSTGAGGRPEPQCGGVPGQSRWPPGPVTSWSHPRVTCAFRPSPSSTCKQQATRDVGEASPVSPLPPVMSWLQPLRTRPAGSLRGGPLAAAQTQSEDVPCKTAKSQHLPRNPADAVIFKRY